MMNLIPPINQVFSLVLQEEKQCEVGSHPSATQVPMAFAVKISSSKSVDDSK